ncbi:zinc finger BED domain-containing protein RICESLEEPER 2-like [Ziziphus jujuba]|uniref:Zinc finger BED domain-containing protein RICESLEEPER 2-like n=1 Tax=Ziziphus jujuba TaxID=326968 RepID=A0ABM4AGD6_ZIZJJ|nr:zinc finger BED domain-containing protein RICESLEEPER 2-like [Ziziphus jujuba]
MHDLPFQFVKYEGIRTIFQYLHPDIQLVYRNTAKSDVLKMHLKEKCRIKCMLDATPGRICLTSDLWTSATTDGYICLTCHFIDKEWILQKRVLNFYYMPPPHIGIALAEKLYSLLCEWGIETKLFSLTLDNASANDVSVDMLVTQLQLKGAVVCDGDYFHLRYCAHIINLVIQNGLKDIDNVVHKIRESIKYVRGLQVRKQKFLECVKLLSMDSKRGLRQDVPIRWNSTYLMLESALYYRRAFCHLELSDSNYKSCSSSHEWEKIEKISRFLGLFYDITCIFWSTKYPTSNLYFSSVFFCYVTLKENIESEDDYLRTMANQMLKKFEKYWSEFSLILTIAVVVDPRYKLQFVDWCYRKIYGASGSSEFIRVKSKLFSIFKEYVQKRSLTSSTHSLDKEKSNTSCGVGEDVISFRKTASSILKVNNS